MTKRFPSTVRFRLRRHPNRVHLTRSNVIRRNTAAPSPSSSPLLSLVLGATLAKSAPPSRVHFSHPPRGPRSIQPAASLRCPPSETELRHGRTEPASCTMPARGAPCWSWWMLSRVSAPWTRVHAGCNPCHPPNRIPPFHRLLPDRNFPPSKFSIPQFPTTTTIPPSSTCFSIKSHTLQKQYIHIYIYFFFLLPPFHLDVIVRGMVRAHRGGNRNFGGRGVNDGSEMRPNKTPGAVSFAALLGERIDRILDTDDRDVSAV